MSATIQHPMLQGAAPPASRTHHRPAKIILGVLALLAVLFILYRTSLVLFEERSALEYQKRGRDFFAQGYFEDAKFELEVASRLGTPSEKTLLLLAKTEAALGHPESAVYKYREAVEADQEDAENHFALALALTAIKKNDEAIEELEKALDLKPGYVAARLLLARLLAKGNRLEDAAKHYQILAGFGMSKKQLAEIHVALAKLLIKQKRPARAQHLLQTAWFMDKQNEEAWRLIMALGRGKGREDNVIGTVQTTNIVRSRITSPEQNAKLDGDTVEISGVSEADAGAVVRMEVTIDGGHSWHDAKPVNGIYNNWVAKIKLPIADGQRYNLFSRASGSSGLPEWPEKRVTVYVDNSGPSVVRQIIPAKPDMADNWYSTSPKIDLAVLEAGSLIFYKWNRGEYQVYTSSITAPVGASRLSYFTRDKAGNESPVENMSIKVKIANG